MICEHCGAEINGLLEASRHPCYAAKAEYHVMNDNEMRNAFMEMGMPNMGFDAMGFAIPTEMERAIFQIPDPEPEPEPERSAEEIAFDPVFAKMTNNERMELVMYQACGLQQGNTMIYGFAAYQRIQDFKEKMRQKYSSND